ncbi:MAG: family phosphohydrolase, partial [Paenibacillus sp.]|nr:family phosphohydrolase [Paenibacillus sp.]
MEHLLGKIVKNDVVNSYGVTIVPAKSIINDEFMKLLLNHKISVDSIILAQDVPESIKPTASVHQAVNRTRQLFELISYTEEVPLEEISSEILPVIQQLSREPDVFQLIEAVKAKDNYTHEHNVGVAVLATLIGRWLNMSETELAILSLAAVLHDVGKVKIPIEILNKPGKLTDRELAVIRKHTIYGYEMLKATPELNQRVARV